MRATSVSRRVSYSLLATGLLAAGLVPLVATAASTPCPAYVDDAGDSAPLDPALAVALGDQALDILSVTHSTDKGVLSTTLQTTALYDYGSDLSLGDIFVVRFTVADKPVEVEVVRDATIEPGTSTSLTVGGEATDVVPGVTYDFEAMTVSLFFKQTDLEKAVGAKLTGQKFSAMEALSYGYYGGPGLLFDEAVAPQEATYTVGDACKTGAAPKPAPAASATPSASASPSAAASPSASASPSGSAEPSASASPEGPPPPPKPAVPVPAPGCVGFADEEGDSDAAVGPAGSGDDPDLDLVSVTGRSTSKVIAGHLGVAQLGSGPSIPVFSGHRFQYEFAVGDLVVVLSADETGPGVGTIDGAANENLVVEAVFDEPSSQVVLSVDRASLVKAVGTALPDGFTLNGLAGRSYALTPASATVADTASPEDPSQATYVIGENPCFEPRLTVTAPASVQTSDAAVVNVAVTTSDGQVAKGQKVSARVGNGPWVAATTDADGLTTLNVPVTDAAGTRTLLVRAAGSAGDRELRSSLRVLVERALLSLRSSGSGTTRTVVATLTDDDAPRRALAGQRVVLSFGGRSVAVTTDSRGRAAVEVPAGSSVDASYAGRPGHLSAAKARVVA